MSLIFDSGIVNLTPAQLFEHLGVTLQPIGDDLEVRFANGDTEHFVPAPDGYPVRGDVALIKYDGRYFIPLDEDDR